MVQRFERPASAEEAARLRAETGGVFLAGGTQLNIGGAPEIETLIALDALGLDSVSEANGAVRLGSTVTLQAIADHGELPGWGLGILCAAARDVGSRAVRNQATLGGNLAARLSYTDMAPPLIALGAVVELRAADGSREVAIEDYVSAPDPDALVTCVRVARPGGAVRVARRRFARTSADLPLVNTALALSVEGASITGARLAIGGLAGSASRLSAAEQALIGKQASEESLLESFAAAVLSSLHPVEDLRGGIEYKSHLAVELSCQALTECLRKEVA